MQNKKPQNVAVQFVSVCFSLQFSCVSPISGGITFKEYLVTTADKMSF